MEKNSSRYYTAKQIQDICEISIASSYRLIHKWNEELKAKGFDVPKSGRIIKNYADYKLAYDVDFKEVFK